MKRRRWTDAELITEGLKYPSRTAFARGSKTAYNLAQRRGLLDHLPQNQRADWSNDADVLAEGRKYDSRKAFQLGSCGAYEAACRRNLLDQLYPSYWRDWSSDADVLAEGRKYASRSEFAVRAARAYEVARQRNLLDLIDFPENKASSDNDAIYIWRAIGQHYNGNPVYKIGVTSARLGVRRVERVCREGGFEFDLICCEPVTCKATDLERKLLILGEDPGYTGFNGATEFRALSDSALYAAVSMICNQI